MMRLQTATVVASGAVVVFLQVLQMRLGFGLCVLLRILHQQQDSGPSKSMIPHRFRQHLHRKRTKTWKKRRADDSAYFAAKMMMLRASAAAAAIRHRRHGPKNPFLSMARESARQKRRAARKFDSSKFALSGRTRCGTSRDRTSMADSCCGKNVKMLGSAWCTWNRSNEERLGLIS